MMKLARCAPGAVALFAAGAAFAQSAMSPPQEYAKYVDHAGSIEAFADFGDQVNLRDGSLQVRYTDIELVGTGPTIRITRTYSPSAKGELYYDETTGGDFGMWQLEIPRIRTSTANSPGVTIYSPVGWQVIGNTTALKDARCTRFSAPGRVTFINDASRGWDASEWWDGYHLVDDRGNDQALMSRNDTSVRSDVPLMTTGNWLVGCLTATANGAPGEAFYALAPDGTKYWFDHMVYATQDMLQKPLWTDPMLRASGSRGRSGDRTIGGDHPVPQSVAMSDQIERQYAALLVTRIEDRFGNWVTYDYTSGRLDSIDASDGRHVGLSRSGTTTTITVGTGTSAQIWTYQPGTLGLQAPLTVTRPDGSQWVYSLPVLPASSLHVEEDPTASCTVSEDDYDVYAQGTIQSPAGATLTLTLDRKRFARSYVPKQCWGGDPTVPLNAHGYAVYPREWYGYALVSRQVTGPGLPTMTWTYDYAPPVSSWAEDCPTQSSCASTVWTDVTAPDGSRRRTIYSNKFDETENKLTREEDYSASSQLLRAVDHAYATVASTETNPYPWLVRVGNDKRERVNTQTSGQWAPERQRLVTQQGKTFEWSLATGCSGSPTCFDSYARPTKVVRSGLSNAYTRTETTTYSDNTAKWILGQVKTVTCNAATPANSACDGDVMSSATYDTTYAMPLTFSEFGKVRQTLAWNTSNVPTDQRGTLHSLTDGNGHATTYANWMRGIPQSVTHADGTTESATVNGLGWITARTDENTYATGYGYDAMGRLASVVPPGGDSTVWNKTKQVFEWVGSIEHGLAAGHWRQTITTCTALEVCDAHKLTWYDGLWRPVLTYEYDDADKDATGRYQRFAYDHDGRTTFASYPAAGDSSTTGTHTSYDALGRPTAVTQDSEQGTLTTTTEYLSGFQRRVTDARHHATTTNYMAYDQPATDWPVAIVAPENQTTVIARDPFGKPTTITRQETAP